MSIKCLIITDPLGGEATEEIVEQVAEWTSTSPDSLEIIGHYEYVSEEAEEKAQHADVLLIDYGGMAIGATSACADQIRWVCEWAKEHPGKLVILLTMFTAEIYFDELDSEFGECDNIITRYCDKYSGDREKASAWLEALTKG